VGDLQVLAIDGKKKKEAIRSIKGMREAMMQKLLVETSNTLTGSPLLATNHLQQRNHWESRYGNHWREELDKSSLMLNYASIQCLVHHIICEGKRIFGGTAREKYWVFYHDALSTMTAKKELSGYGPNLLMETVELLTSTSGSNPVLILPLTSRTMCVISQKTSPWATV
jgi:hypothetical protein